jgi:hypothetical protein
MLFDLHSFVSPKTAMVYFYKSITCDKFWAADVTLEKSVNRRDPLGIRMWTYMYSDMVII